MADQVQPLGTPTTNYGWTKPTVGGDADAWGGMINTDLDGIDSTVHTIQTSVPAASTTTPAMNGTAAVGTGTTFARADHVHPTDTSLLSSTAAASGDLTGNYPGPTLVTTGVTAGSYTYSTISVDGKGRILSASSGSAPVAPPAPSSTTPLMDGTAATGTGTTYARADHVHPSDTTRAPLASPAFTGTPSMPTGTTGVTQTAGNNSTALATTAFVASAVATGVAGPFAYSALPAEVQNLPVTFVFSGLPQASALVTAPVVMAITVASNLAASQGYASTAPTGTATFTLNKISGGSTTGIGTVVFTTGAKAAANFAGGGGSLAIGDVLQMVAPSTQDTTMADVGITIMAKRT